ncbi:MAG TPA: hypothetical protein VEU62_02600, partial [Bryobacterales bacterium]|nr:hypothetical protein [Bryobacterales bacterium]
PPGAYMIIPEEWGALRDRVLFAAQLGDSTNLWQLPLSADGRAAGTPQRLTSGSGLELHPSAAPGGLFVFASLQDRVDIWKLPMEVSQAKVTGGMERLTSGAAAKLAPVVSGDGKKVVFVSKRSGRPEVWLKDLESGKETALAAINSLEGWPAVSADGSKVAYGTGENDRRVIYVAPTSGGVPERVCEDCNTAWSLTSHAKKMLYWPPGRSVGLLDLASRQKTEILQRPGYAIYRTRFSPDDRWIAFHARNRPGRSTVFVAPFRGATAIADRDWIPVTDGESYDLAPSWSPDGGVLYFISERDGFRCLWAARLDPATKHPAGPPLPIQHFHTATRSMIHLTTNWLGLSAARDMLVFNLGEMSGNVWMAKAGTRE